MQAATITFRTFAGRHMAIVTEQGRAETPLAFERRTAELAKRNKGTRTRVRNIGLAVSLAEDFAFTCPILGGRPNRSAIREI